MSGNVSRVLQTRKMTKICVAFLIIHYNRDSNTNGDLSPPILPLLVGTLQSASRKVLYFFFENELGGPLENEQSEIDLQGVRKLEGPLGAFLRTLQIRLDVAPRLMLPFQDANLFLDALESVFLMFLDALESV